MHLLSLAWLASSLLAEATRPDPPVAVKSVEAKPIDAKTGSFVIDVTPALMSNGKPYTRYQYTVDPKLCRFPGTTTGEGALPTVNFLGAPYRTMLICACGQTYTPAVVTAPIAKGGPSSSPTKGSPITPPCAHH
jgi:hypothetical protein